MERATGQDDFLARPNFLVLLAQPIGDPYRSLALKQNFRGAGLCYDGQVGSVHDRVQVSGGRRTTLSVLIFAMELGDLINADTLVVAGVEVVRAAVLKALRRLYKGMGNRAWLFLIRYLQRAAIPMKIVRSIFVVL